MKELTAFLQALQKRSGESVKGIEIKLPIRFFRYIIIDIMHSTIEHCSKHHLPPVLPWYFEPIQIGKLYLWDSLYGKIAFRPTEDIDYTMKKELDRQEETIIPFE